jgi:hypothetical protein bfra3_07017|nr:MAG TPA: hypothetical protein [Caudoviricetes sp.]
MMKNFSIKDVLLDVIGYKGLPYPGVWFPEKKRANDNGGYEYSGSNKQVKTHSETGSLLRRRDSLGRYYFLPVTLVHKGKEYEIPNAVISLTGKKTIIETAMVGRKGSVKELINIDDYEINVQGVALSDDFPESILSELEELYNINESITLKCALTDIFLDEDDRVVIKSIELSDMKGTEEFQVLKMNLVTDRNFELILE